MNPRDFAERCLLGCVLDDPQIITSMEWLRPEDFYTPEHTVVFSHIREMVAAGANPTPVDVYQRIAASDQRPQVSAVQMHTWMAARPQAAQPHLYAAMVLEASVRRHAVEYGVRVAQTAESPDLLRMLDMVEQAAADIEQAAQRWASVQADNDRTRLTERSQPTFNYGSLPLDAVPTEIEQRRAEDAVISIVLNQPRALDHLGDRLDRYDFADDELGITFDIAKRMHQRGEHVDIVTVAWEQQRRGGGAAVARLVPLVGEVSIGTLNFHAEIVMRGALAQRVGQAAVLVQQAAQQPSLDPTQLFHRTHAAYQGIRDAASRMTRKENLAAKLVGTANPATSREAIRRGEQPTTARPTVHQPNQDRGHDRDL